MNAQQALEFFLAKILVKNKRNRFLGFIAKPKSQTKFLDAIYHELQSCFDDAYIVDSLPDSVLSMSGYIFEPPTNFGGSVAKIRDIYQNIDESFLVVSKDGKYGIYGPETFIDDRTYYSI